MELAADNPFTAILEDGETILWMGKPDKDLINQYEKRRWRFFAGGILACLFYGAFSSVFTGDPDRVLLFILALIFLPLAIGPFFADWSGWQRRYALTNKRVLYHSSLTEDGALYQIALGQISLVRFGQNKRGSSIVFNAKPPFKVIAFEHIADVAEVQELVVSLLTGVRLEARK